MQIIGEFREYLKSLIAVETIKRKEALEKSEAARKVFCQQNGRKFRKKSAEVMNAPGVIFSESTDYGLLVTLKAVQELSEFLIKDCGFCYVMTARFNQDALEVCGVVYIPPQKIKLQSQILPVSCCYSVSLAWSDSHVALIHTQSPGYLHSSSAFYQFTL